MGGLLYLLYSPAASAGGEEGDVIDEYDEEAGAHALELGDDDPVLVDASSQTEGQEEGHLLLMQPVPLCSVRTTPKVAIQGCDGPLCRGLTGVGRAPAHYRGDHPTSPHPRDIPGISMPAALHAATSQVLWLCCNLCLHALSSW